jgi:KDO2-lipid IV(A) lauroyltransferase
MAEPAQKWPVPWEGVAGDRGGLMAQLEYAAFRGALWSGSRLPAAGQRALAGAIARLAKLVDARHTNAARGFIAQALGPRATGDERERLVLAAWRHLIELTLEDARFNDRVLGPQLLSHFEVVMPDDVKRALAMKRGGLVITPHVGMWEALPAVCAALGFAPAYVVSRPPRNRPLSRFAQATREARGYRLVHRHGAVAAITQVVAAGGWVGLMLDQRARGKTVLAPFFGRLAHCERGVAVLARRLRVPVVSAACYRTERPFHYRAEFPRVMWPEELARMDPEAIATEINRELERMILARPEQYFWLHDRYRKAPAAGDAGARSSGAELEPGD